MTFTSRLLAWYADNGRQLPWRATTDPYRIWVSEIILQQTRVAQGYDYYRRFLERFPSVEALAEASQDDVMRQWEGLGYYNRARNMHAAARQIVGLGAFPADYAGVRALKGIGDYTAAAICSFAYGLPHAVVDGNVYRVLSRFFAIATPIDTTAGRHEFAALAQSLIDTRHPAHYNQAIMDLGALVCLPRSPRCEACPVVESCMAHAEDSAASYPVKSKKTAVADRYFAYIIILDECTDVVAGNADPSTAASAEGPCTYIRRRPEGDIWAGLYEPLLVETSERAAQADVVPEGGRVVRVVEGLRHQLTHRTLHADAYVVEGCADASRLAAEGYLRVPLSRLAHYPAPRLVNIIYEKMFGPTSR